MKEVSAIIIATGKPVKRIENCMCRNLINGDLCVIVYQYGSIGHEFFEPLNLCILSDRPISVGDWFLWVSTSGIKEIHRYHSDAGYGIKTYTEMDENGCSILVNHSGVLGRIESAHPTLENLPQITPVFLREYAEKGGMGKIWMQMTCIGVGDDAIYIPHVRPIDNCLVLSMKEEESEEQKAIMHDFKNFGKRMEQMMSEGNQPAEPCAAMKYPGEMYQELFNFFHDEHNLLLLEGEMHEIIHQVEKFLKPAETAPSDGVMNFNEWFNCTYPDDDLQTSDFAYSHLGQEYAQYYHEQRAKAAQTTPMSAEVEPMRCTR